MSLSNFYNTSVGFWQPRDPTDLIVITDLDNVTLARIPFEFVEKGGDCCARNEYLWILLRALLQKSTPTHVDIHCEGQAIKPDQKLASGVYIAQVRLGQDVFEAPGPHAKTTTYKPFFEFESETVSDSARSSCGGQSIFRRNLFQRDQRCLITQTFHPTQLVACHIVPFSLGLEFVARISNGLCNLYSPSNGLTLRSDLHAVFDDYSLGVYHSEGKYVIHCFSGDRALLGYHGQEITFSSLVRAQAPDWLPNIECLDWHYAQCVLTRFRGYHVAFPNPYRQ